MGWVLMSERDLNRLEVLAQIDDGHLSVGNGANIAGAYASSDLPAAEAVPQGRRSGDPAQGTRKASQQSHP